MKLSISNSRNPIMYSESWFCRQEIFILFLKSRVFGVVMCWAECPFFFISKTRLNNGTAYYTQDQTNSQSSSKDKEAWVEGRRRASHIKPLNIQVDEYINCYLSFSTIVGTRPVNRRKTWRRKRFLENEITSRNWIFLWHLMWLSLFLNFVSFALTVKICLVFGFVYAS